MVCPPFVHSETIHPRRRGILHAFRLYVLCILSVAHRLGDLCCFNSLGAATYLCCDAHCVGYLPTRVVLVEAAEKQIGCLLNVSAGYSQRLLCGSCRKPHHRERFHSLRRNCCRLRRRRR